MRSLFYSIKLTSGGGGGGEGEGVTFYKLLFPLPIPLVDDLGEKFDTPPPPPPSGRLL